MAIAVVVLGPLLAFFVMLFEAIRKLMRQLSVEAVLEASQI